ncbi:heterokaryon incompatibility protein-domain-containing protein [Lasiosphaeria miniovina]|uniref:Heterokaryon incompatibility protein-domain-containing protein n=1 Tax=Lasiosphaeria miniovina TaxID=1954250 RepID=A0AA40BF10_9PEZI|nr:heterokaryon incompatibility protein-domain-containing protein [Lasiosphaeria miniovina]KAK0733049.1 heterokaryon incompatibility protein-domain-containing protein [Lasiosphaeria miniovina]
MVHMMEPIPEQIDCTVCSVWIREFEESPDELIVESKLYPRSIRDAAADCPICAAFVDLYSPIRTHERDIRDPWGIFPIENEITTGAGLAACHRVAASTGTDQPLPSRLIKIDKQAKRLELVETAGKTGRYLCLSHCWGTKHTFETTTATLAQMLRGFAVDEMPAIYREAVVVAHMLGISYLWIDSLCIIQDDRDDWLREAAQMADIYSKCYLTIAATRAASNTETMHHDRNDYESLGITKTGRPYRLLSHGNTSHPGVGMLYGEDRRFPLLTRGWIFQERLLSPRLLHFGPDELIWECQETMQCECQHARGLGLSKPGHAKLLANGTADELALSWRHLVEQYSVMRLTRNSDKLPAFSGVAKQFSERRPGAKYLAGLWSASLVDDMLWYCNEFNQKDLNTKPNAWRAPSWSWAAVDQRVYYPSSGYFGDTKLEVHTRYPTVFEAACLPAGADATAEPTGGHITLAGPVLRGRYTARERYSDIEYDLQIDTPVAAAGEQGASPSTTNTTLFSTESLIETESDTIGRTRRNRIYFDHRDPDAAAELRPNRYRWPATQGQQRMGVDVLCVRMARMLRRNAYNLAGIEHILMLREKASTATTAAGEDAAGGEAEKKYERVGMAVIAKDYYRRFAGGESPTGEDRFKPLDFTAAEEAELWSDFVSPFDAAVAENEVVTIL